MKILMNEVAVDGGAGAPPAPEVVTSALAAAAPEIQLHERFAEKHRVFKEDGAFDLEATAVKNAEAYSSLEKRLGTGDVPPATAEEYKLENLPEGMDVQEIMADPVTQSFLKRCHAKGMTNAQVEDVANFMLAEWAPKLLENKSEMVVDDCVAELKTFWKSDAEYSANMIGANKAFNAYADPADRGKIDEIGNNPIVIRMLANIAKEMREDVPPNPQNPGGSAETIETLLSHPAYGDAKHPEHAAVNKKISDYYTKKYGTAPAQ